MSKKLNKNFNYELDANQFYTIISDNFIIKYTNDTSKNSFKYFEKLSWDDNLFLNKTECHLEKNNLLKIGKICYNKEYLPIDFINKYNLEIIQKNANILNKQKLNDNQEYGINVLIKTDNIFNVIGTFKRELTSSTNYNSKYNKIYDQDYTHYLYRAAKNYSANIKNINGKYIIVNSENLPYNVPIFTVETNSENFNFCLVLRNMKVPMRKIKTSTRNGIMTFIIAYPEYIIANYDAYIKSMMYIELESGEILNNKIYYSFLKDDLLYPKTNGDIIGTSNNQKYLKASNLQSSRVFFE